MSGTELSNHWWVCCGCSCATVQYANEAELAYQCGNSVVLLHVQSGQQRVLGSSAWHGIQAFACSVKGGVVAMAVKEPEPIIKVFSTRGLQLQADVAAGINLEYTAVALSHDGALLAACADCPDLELSIWDWRKGIKLAAAKLHAPVRQISFHPADHSCLLTTTPQPADCSGVQGAAGSGSHDLPCTAQATLEGDAQQRDGCQRVLLWQLHKLWGRHLLTSFPLQVDGHLQPTCHAWAPEGVYVGCIDGSVVCFSPETGATIGCVSAAAQAEDATMQGTVAGTAEPVTDKATGVSTLALNKRWLVVAFQRSPHLSFFRRCTSSTSTSSSSSGSQRHIAQLQLLGRLRVSSVGCWSLAVGGPLHAQLAVTTVDGSLLLLCPGSQLDPNQPDPESLQIEPLADWHVGAITGLAGATAGSHLLSCGVDGSIRVWTASAGGQLLSKRDVGGQLTCCATFVDAGSTLLAVGSSAGVLRLINTADISSLPVVYRSRLFKGPISQVAFSHGAACLAATAGSTCQVALLKVAEGGQQVQLLGYVNTQGAVLSLCWLPLTASKHHPQLLLGLSNGSLMLLTVPVCTDEVSVGHASTQSSSSSSSGIDGSMLGQTQGDLAAAVSGSVTWTAPACMQALSVLPDQLLRTRAGSTAANMASSHSLQVLGAGSNRQLYWLQLPTDSASVHSTTAGTLQLTVADQAPLPWQAAALAVRTTGHEVLVGAADGAVLLLPTAATAAKRILSTTKASTVAAAAGADAGPALAWSPDASWAASSGPDGSLVVYTTGASGRDSTPAAAALPGTLTALQDIDAPDDSTAPTVPEELAEKAQQEAYAAAEPIRRATLQRLQDLKRRLDQVLEANAAAPREQQLSEAELVLNSEALAEQRGAVAADEARILLEAPRASLVQEVQAKRLKAICWDAFQVKRAVCTGLRSGDVQAWNFQLPLQDDSSWAQVAEQRREQLLASHKHLLEQEFYARSAASSMMAGSLATTRTSGSDAVGSITEARSSLTHSSDGGAVPIDTPPSTTAAGSASGCPQEMQELLAALARIKACREAKDCKAADLLLPELEVTTLEAKCMQAEVYKRMAWELKLQFNQDFANIVKQKHTDADRLTDLNTRVDELIRELVKIHFVLNPAAAAAEADTQSAAAQAAASAACPSGTSANDSGNTSARDASSSSARPALDAADGHQHVLTAAQLSADLGVGRLVPFWSREEDLEDMLLSIKPSEIQATEYLSPAERAKADAEAEAAEVARRAAAADSSRGRALQQMMGGRLERSVDEVSELVTSRPAWMASGDPSTYSEEQLREYKEYTAREAAAIEERLKRKGIMEMELRTLKAAAEEVASKFDAALAALAAKRLDVLAEVTALEARALQLLADEEMATVTAGVEAQDRALHALQAAHEALTAVEQELSAMQHMHVQQQEALAALHAEEKATDRAFKRDFGHVDPLVMPQLAALYKARLVPRDQAGSQAAPGDQPSAAAPGRTASASRAAVGLSPRQRGAQGPGSPCASRVGAGAGGFAGRLDLLQPQQAQQTGAAGQHPDSSSAELTFTPLQLPLGTAAGSFPPAVLSEGGAHVVAAAPRDLCGPLGPVEMCTVQLADRQMPEGLDDGLWQRFVELHAARAQLDLAVRQQTAQVLCLKSHVQLLLQQQLELSEQAQAAALSLEGLRQQQQRALQDVEVQLRLKQGQVEVWPSGLASIAPEALLLPRQHVKGFNSVILSKGDAKLDMLRKMKEFKRGIHQLEWENRKCEMEAQDVTSLTQQLQLLHVTKEFQQQVKGSNSGISCSDRPGSLSSTAPAAGQARTNVTAGSSAGGTGRGAGGATAAGSAAAANKEVASLENLLKVRETLHCSSVEQKKRQLRSLEGQLAAKRNENATLALHLAGLERLLDESARLRATATADDAVSAAARKARSLAMHSKLRDIADAQAAEIVAAQRELQVWQQRCFPCLPGLPGDDDQQPSGGADQASAGCSRSLGAGSCTLPEIKGAQGHVVDNAAGSGAVVGAGGFAPHRAREVAARGHEGMSSAGAAGPFAVRRNVRTYIGPDGKPSQLCKQ